MKKEDFIKKISSMTKEKLNEFIKNKSKPIKLVNPITKHK